MGYFGPIIGLLWGYYGLFGAYFGAIMGYFGLIMGLLWAILGLFWAYYGPIMGYYGLFWAYFGLFLAENPGAVHQNASLLMMPDPQGKLPIHWAAAQVHIGNLRTLIGVAESPSAQLAAKDRGGQTVELILAAGALPIFISYHQNLHFLSSESSFYV